MSATTITADASRTPGVRLRVSPAQSPNRRRFGHYLNLAATIALVAAVAIAGWFAAMQLNQGDGPEPRLAVMGTPVASPGVESASCDVEPLSTDRVMEIVKNPALFRINGTAGEPSDTAANVELTESNPDLMLAGETTAPNEEQFSSASEVVNVYLACMVNGTQSQIWTFYSPVSLQQKILAEFPVFANEQQVRERVEELASQPAYLAEFHWDRASIRESSSITVNPDFQIATFQRSESYFYEYVLSVGVSIENAEGEQVVLTNGLGRNLLPRNDGIDLDVYVRIAKPRDGEGWVIIPWPSKAEGRILFG